MKSLDAKYGAVALQADAGEVVASADKKVVIKKAKLRGLTQQQCAVRSGQNLV